MARIILLIFSVIASMILACEESSQAQVATREALIVLQVKGQVLADGREVTPQMQLTAENRIAMPPSASVIAITSAQKIEIDGPNAGRLGDIVADAKLEPGGGQSGPLNWIYGLLQKGVEISATRDEIRARLTSPWFLRLDTEGPKCVQSNTAPILVAPPGEERHYLRLSDVKRNQTSSAQIGSDGKVAWPSDLPLEDGASYAVNIDGVSSTLFWQMLVTPPGTKSPADIAKWLIDSKCVDQLYVFALELPNSIVVDAK